MFFAESFGLTDRNGARILPVQVYQVHRTPGILEAFQSIYCSTAGTRVVLTAEALPILAVSAIHTVTSNYCQYYQYPQYRTPEYLKYRQYPELRSLEHCECSMSSIEL